MDNELLLYDRLEVIKTTINKYGEENFYISFSGGKDSTVVSKLVDMALPENKIPRVFINTGIEYNAIVKFVKELAEQDNRFVIIKPSKPIKETLEKYGYPFKSKLHAKRVHEYHARNNMSLTIQRYLNGCAKDGSVSRFKCPNILKYQFDKDYTFNISHLCCEKLKKQPVRKWMEQAGKTIGITGMRREEGGVRVKLTCILIKNGKAVKFHPLAVVSDDWENWFIEKERIQLCELYYEPYNFERTGCKGCPFALHLQDDLETMERYLPAERKQCEYIWKPVYEEYRRLGYRLKKNEQMKLL